MIISPSFAISAFALPTSLSSNHSSNNITPVFCYDYHYAREHPNLRDCANILKYQVASSTESLIFSRNAATGEFSVPHSWTFARDVTRGCRVTVDIPKVGRRPQREESSMLAVKKAALEVIKDCVGKGDHLGGIAQTGKRLILQVQVQAIGEVEQRDRVSAEVANVPPSILNASTPGRPSLSSLSPILCYDPRYATIRPRVYDCQSILSQHIPIPPKSDGPINFSRNPIDGEFRVPHEWTTKSGDCKVVIDTPDLGQKPVPREESTWKDIRKAAVELVAACVARGSRLGGIVSTGENWNLQVRVEGRKAPRAVE